MAISDDMTLARRSPGAFEAAVQRGLQASHADEVGAALSAWEQASALDPSSAVPHLLIGAELAQAGRPIEAEDAYARAVALAPGFEAARFQLGLLQFTMGREALADVTWGPLFQGDGVGPFRLFVKAFSALARDEAAEAASLFELGMAANTTNAALNRDIARVLVAIQARMPRTDSAASAAAAGEQPAVDAGHVLLAAYRQQGLSH